MIKPKCYYFMPDLPPVPQQFVDLALETAKNWQDHVDSLVNRLSITFENQESRFVTPTKGSSLASKPYVEFDGTTVSGRQQPRINLSNEWQQWVRENISDRVTDTGVSTSIPTNKEDSIDSQAGTLHSDGARKFALFYILKKTNDDQWTRWYQPESGPLISTLTVDGVAGNILDLNKNKVVMVDEICMPVGAWVYTDVRVLHQATNHQGERIAIHVSFQDDVFDMFGNNDELNKVYL